MLIPRLRPRPEPSGPYWKQRSWQLSAAFLALVMLVGGFVALTSDRDLGPASAVPSAGPLTGVAATAQDGRPQGCHTDDSAGDTLPKSAPKDISWHTLGIARVPVSGSAGPTRTSGVLRWCFAHTPVGAALAATVIPSQMSGSGWRAVTDQQVMAGRGRDLFRFQRATVQDVDSAADNGGASTASYAGFAVTSYTRTAASVRLLLRTGQGYASTVILLRWSGGDWKVVPDDSGSLHTSVATVSGDTNGFVLWGV
ncbi:hypothetical protein ABZ619_17105 [Streptomyces sp. NPDC007851]|uniref:hypothetical protein n=1 Tax=Streptomyces sp. NPDC007851 TaxID=3155008 RepID=UPI0033DD63C1